MPHHLGGCSQQPPDQVLVDPQLAGGATAWLKTQAAVQFAAPQLLVDTLAHGRLDRTQLLRQPDMRLEIPVIDAPHLPGELSQVAPFLAPGKSGHAANHWNPFKIRLKQSVYDIKEALINSGASRLW